MVIAQRPFAIRAHPSFPRSEKDSALVALPLERRLAEKRWHYTMASVWEPLHEAPGFSSTADPICAASMHTILR